eukprot:5578490-Prymnesium_polylepis.1
MARAELYLTRGQAYALQIVAIDNPFAITTAGIGGAATAANLITTGLDFNPLEYGQMHFTPDASLPS